MKHNLWIGIMMCTVAALATVIAAGCASAPIRTDTSTSTIRAAEELGSADVPMASLHVQFAKEEVARAEELAAKGEKQRAESMLSRAEADAQLAVALSREDAERAVARAEVEKVRRLRQANQ